MLSPSTAATLGIDLGTGSCKVRILAQDGTCVAQAEAAYPTLTPQSGWAEQDAACWLPAVAAAIGAARKNAPQARIVGLGLTSAAHIAVLLDKANQPIRPAILWQDLRSAPQAAQLNALHGEGIVAETLHPASPAWCMAHLAWVRECEPYHWARLHTLLFSKDFLLFQLTGQLHTDAATAVAGQLYNAKRRTWSTAMCQLSGVDLGRLPPVGFPEQRGGHLLPDAARQLGLEAGLPVFIGALDSATELLAAGALTPGQSVVRLGTAGGVQGVVTGPAASQGLTTYPHTERPYWYRQAGTSTCAAAVRWGRQLLGAAQTPFSEWDAGAAAVVPGAEGLLFHPYLAGERAPLFDSTLRATFQGLALHHGPGHIARAIYEGTACSMRHAASLLPELPAELPVVGGGAHSTVWLQILAGVLNRTLHPMPHADSAAGAALLAWRGLGTAVELTEPTRSSPVEPVDVEIYERVFDRYLDQVRGQWD